MSGRTLDWSNAATQNIGNYVVSVVATVNSTETACTLNSTFELEVANSQSLEVIAEEAPEFSTDLA
jgi:hypothetical protein